MRKPRLLAGTFPKQNDHRRDRSGATIKAILGGSRRRESCHPAGMPKKKRTMKVRIGKGYHNHPSRRVGWRNPGSKIILERLSNTVQLGGVPLFEGDFRVERSHVQDRVDRFA
jgi:hypothetical protein